VVVTSQVRLLYKLPVTELLPPIADIILCFCECSASNNHLPANTGHQGT
jgi:hypothetical protein